MRTQSSHGRSAPCITVRSSSPVLSPAEAERGVYRSRGTLAHPGSLCISPEMLCILVQIITMCSRRWGHAFVHLAHSESGGVESAVGKVFLQVGRDYYMVIIAFTVVLFIIGFFTVVFHVSF